MKTTIFISSGMRRRKVEAMPTQQMSNPRETRPDPDPTARTNEQLYREIDALRKECSDRATALRELIETRLNGNDKAIELLQKATDKHPEIIKAAVDQLQEVHEEKFARIETQFKEKGIALDAALQTSEKSGAKTEISFTKQIDAIAVNIQTMAGNLSDKIDDLKGRLTTIEGKSAGVATTIGVIFSIVMALGSFSGLIGLWLSRR